MGKPKHGATVGVVAAVLLLAGSLASAASIETTYPFRGVTHHHYRSNTPRLVDVHLVEIDPTAPGIGFLTTPSNGAAPGETVQQTTRSFVTQHNLQMGINANFFAFVSGSNMDVLGIGASNGDVYSPFYAGWPGINITQNNQVNLVIPLPSNVSHEPPDFFSGYVPVPNVPLYNAVGGNEHIVNNGQVFIANDNALHPRSAAGVTAAGKLLLFTVDGRNTNHSQGMTTPEVANLLIKYGAVQAVNLDGGGSTTLVFSDPTPRVVNVPVGISNQPGTERSNGNNLGVYAQPHAQPQHSAYVFADFEGGDRGLLSLDPGSSGSTQGINEAVSTNTAVQAVAFDGQWSQRLTIVNDPDVNNPAENPGGGWFVRHVSGSTAGRSQNEPRPTEGYVGFWAKTDAQGVDVSIAIDNTNNVTADRGLRKTLIADGNWHLYEWNLDDNNHWEGWFQGDGQIDTVDFTLDSLMFFGPTADATIYIDGLTHYTGGSLRSIFDLLPGDTNQDGIVNMIDLNNVKQNFGATGSPVLGDTNGDGLVDIVDYNMVKNNFGAVGAAVAVPEPSAAIIAMLLLLIHTAYCICTSNFPVRKFSCQKSDGQENFRTGR